MILKKSAFLAGDSISFIDIAIFPFIRQFALFDMNWFTTSPYKNTQNWLNTFLCQTDFNEIVRCFIFIAISDCIRMNFYLLFISKYVYLRILILNYEFYFLQFYFEC